MPEVQKVGVADYAQYQPSQYPNESYVEEYNTQPEVYDEHAEQMKVASKSRLGETLFVSAALGLAIWGGHKWGKKAAATEIEKAKEAVANYEKAQKAMEEVEKIADDNAGKFFGTKRIGKEFYNKIKELFKPFKKAGEEGKEEIKEGTEKVADEAKDAAKELEEKATDSNK